MTSFSSNFCWRPSWIGGGRWITLYLSYYSLCTKKKEKTERGREIRKEETPCKWLWCYPSESWEGKWRAPASGGPAQRGWPYQYHRCKPGIRKQKPNCRLPLPWCSSLETDNLQFHKEEKEILNHWGDWLKNWIMDPAQILLMCQFPYISGFDTVLQAESLSYDCCPNNPFYTHS